MACSPAGQKKLERSGPNRGSNPGPPVCLRARRAAPARTQNRNHTSMLEPFYGFDHSAECPKAKIYRWRRKILRPAHLWGEVFFHEKVTYIQSRRKTRLKTRFPNNSQMSACEHKPAAAIPCARTVFAVPRPAPRRRLSSVLQRVRRARLPQRANRGETIRKRQFTLLPPPANQP